jgi:hypothetical protein
MSQRPAVTGLMICEKAIIEERTHNVSLINCFTKYRVERVPSEDSRFVVFAILVDGLGDITLDLMVLRLETDEVIFQQAQEIQFVDRLQEVRFLFRVRGCAFPALGAYQVSLLADGEMLAQHRIQIFQ